MSALACQLVSFGKSLPLTVTSMQTNTRSSYFLCLMMQRFQLFQCCILVHLRDTSSDVLQVGPSCLSRLASFLPDLYAAAANTESPWPCGDKFDHDSDMLKLR